MSPPDRGDLLVVVDMQEVFREPSSGWFAPGVDGLVGPVERLEAGFGERVCFTRFVVPAEPHGSWADYYRRWPFVTGPDAAPLLELMDPWRGRRPSTLDLPTFSKWGAELAAARGSSGALVLCGTATDNCVLATALGAVDAGVPVRVVADACAGPSLEAHARALALLAALAPQVVLTSVAEELAGRSS